MTIQIFSGRRQSLEQQRGRTHLLLAIVVGPLATHSLRDVTPFLLPTEAPLTHGRSLRLFHSFHKDLCCISSPSPFVVCDHPPPPCTVVISFPLSNVSNIAMQPSLKNATSFTFSPYFFGDGTGGGVGGRLSFLHYSPFVPQVFFLFFDPILRYSYPSCHTTTGSPRCF